tara:strand:- start:1500 stop:2897 length:1398 start_codon:yes stop_codon:yes gene_type:complete
MRKFLQWALVATIAVLAIGVIAHSLFTTSTRRARDVSVGALREKLARLGAEEVTPGTPAHVATPTAPETPPSAPEDDATSELQDRWRVAFSELQTRQEACLLSRALSAPLVVRVETTGGLTLSVAELAEVAAYRSCLGDVLDELLALCAASDDLYALYATFPVDDVPIFGNFLKVRSEVSRHFMAWASEQNHARAVEAYTAMLNLSHIRWFGAPQVRVAPEIIWPIIRSALESGQVTDNQWQRLLVQLEAQRDPNNFFQSFKWDVEDILDDWEDFNGTLSQQIEITREPLSYLQNWSYYNITTPLFNHDLEVFSRAMDVLLDLAHRPYYEIEPELEQFYIDFDVEPSMDEQRFIRQNRSWANVLYYSRVGIPKEAQRQAEIDVVRAAILLDRWQREEGSYPETLHVLVDDGKDSFPISPIDGKPYLYEREADGYRLGYRHPPNVHGVTLTLWSGPETGDEAVSVE